MQRKIQQDGEPMGGHEPGRTVDYRLKALLASFSYAFAGVWHLVRTQRNAQIHLLVGACALALGATLRIERWEWVALTLTITLVLAAEGANTAVEAAIDLVTAARHPLAKIAKDVAAGTVLLCAIASIIVGCTVFLPHLWPVVVGIFAHWPS
jgi:diacylglycerol kinase (ATP)